MKVFVWLTVFGIAMTMAVSGEPASSTPEEYYREALEAVSVEDYTLAEVLVSRALGQSDREDAVTQARALRLIAKYESRTGREEFARVHVLAAEVVALGAVYTEQHPEMVHLRRQLKEAEAQQSLKSAAQSD